MFFKTEKSSNRLPLIEAEDVSFDVVLYLVDYDGCLSHRDVIESNCKNIILKNNGLLETFKNKHKLNSQDSIRMIGLGSARQSVGQDIANARRHKNGSCFVDIKQVADELEMSVAPILLPDIFGDLSKGTTLFRGLNPNNQEPHPSFIPDASKLTLLHAQIHSVAEDYPNKQICIDFCDDTNSILSDLIDYYTCYSQMIPSNVTLCISHYSGRSLITLRTFQGTGEFDVHFRQTVIDMIAITEKPKKGPRLCAVFVTPGKLIEYRCKHIEQVSEKNECLYTYKSDHLQAELETWNSVDRRLIKTAAIATWTAENIEMRAELFKRIFIGCIKENFFYGMQSLGYLDESSLFTVCTPTSGLTLLHIAVLHRNATAVDYLLEKYLKKDISLNDLTPLEPATYYANKSALCLSIDQSYDEIAYMLFKKGAYPPSPQVGENHLVHVLTRQNKYNEIKKLLEEDSRLINFPDKKGKTILFYANKLSDPNLSRWLIKQGALEQEWHTIEYDSDEEYIGESDEREPSVLQAGIFKLKPVHGIISASTNEKFLGNSK